MSTDEKKQYNERAMAILVNVAITLDARVREMEKELKELKDELIASAEESPDKSPTDGGGWSVVYTGEDGGIARITQPGDKLKSTIDAEKPKGAKLMELVGRHKEELFLPALKYLPVENFRERLQDLFEARDCRKILSLVLSESSPSVSFETKQPEVRS